MWAVYVCVVIVGSLLPGNSAPVRALLIPGADKIQHFLVYVLMVLPVAVFAPARKLTTIACLAGVLGLVLEYLQALTPGRSVETADSIANVLGVGAGYALACIWRSGNSIVVAPDGGSGF